MIRTLVPSVALIAVAVSASAADNDWLKPEFRFGGFIDTIADVGNDAARNNPATTVNEDRWYNDFAMFGGAFVDIRFNDTVGGRVELWLIPFGTSYSDTQLRNAYAYIQGDEWSAKAGRLIREFGLISPYQDQIYRVNESTIGYVQHEPISENAGIFGNDPIGVSATWHRRDLPIEITGMLNNGYWAWVDGGDGRRPASGRERNDLGYGVDALFKPNDQVRLDLGVAYERHSYIFNSYTFGMRDGQGITALGGTAGTFSYTHGALDRGGQTVLVDLNAVIKPQAVSPLTTGAEIAWFSIGDGYNGGNKVSNSGYERWQGLAFANWAFQHASFPMSITGELQHIQAKSDNNDTHGRAWEAAVAYLTQPFRRVPLHLDAELAYETVDTQQQATSHGFELSGRALLTF